MNYTPGPWGYTGRSETGHLDSIYVYSKNPECKRQTCIGEVYMDDAEPQSTEANARLVAAAPEMYDLLNKLRVRLVAREIYSAFFTQIPSLTDGMAEEINALLRRINGEESAE